MSNWFGTKRYSPGAERGVKVPNCGTTACIGGWAIAVKRSENPAMARLFANSKQEDTFCMARRTLRLSEAQAMRLFILHRWPGYYQTRFIKAASLTARAKVAARRIDKFIATKGAQ